MCTCPSWDQVSPSRDRRGSDLAASLQAQTAGRGGSSESDLTLSVPMGRLMTQSTATCRPLQSTGQTFAVCLRLREPPCSVHGRLPIGVHVWR